MAEADLSKIVSIIMENPKLVEEIRDMVTKSDVKNESNATAESSENSSMESEVIPSIASSEESTYKESRSSRRNDLLRAIRPYVSKERGRAIESMITIADILFTIKET